MIEQENAESTILVIEPSLLFREILKSIIEPLSLDVVYYKSAHDAFLEVGDFSRINLVFCASEMADIKGIEACKTLTTMVGKNTPILLLSTITEKDLIREALIAGVTEVIQRDRLIEVQPYLQKIANSNVDPDVRKPHVLFVEDSVAVSMMVVSYLQENGYFVDATESAEEAITLLGKFDYDIVITDILLEGSMTGINLIKYIRDLEEPKNHIPILAISGLNKDCQKIQSLRMGATDFVTKPLNYEEFNVRLINLVKTKRLFDRVYDQGEQLKKLAMNDPLTGLYNRHYLSNILPKRLKESERHNQALSIILLDLDHFKQLNDVYGHLHGDQVLKDVGQLLIKNCREEDFAVRFGGEEFIVILPHCSIDDAKAKALKIKQQIEELIYHDHKVTGSFGVAGKLKNSQDISFNQLFELADKAVYEAKDTGRNKVVSSRAI